MAQTLKIRKFVLLLIHELMFDLNSTNPRDVNLKSTTADNTDAQRFSVARQSCVKLVHANHALSFNFSKAIL